MRTNRSGPGSAWILGLIIAVCAAAGAAGAATIVVAPSGSIADGLAAAAAGDTVLVSCGHYYEQGLEMPDGVVLRGESGEPGCVVISPELGGIPLLVCTGTSDATVVKDLTFAPTDIGFTTPPDRGGAVSCEGGAPQFRGCRFTGLVAGYGGAVYCRDASPSFVGCEFLTNQALAAGGAVAAVGASHPTLDGCLLAGNAAGSNGAAVNLALGAAADLVRCTVVDGGAGLGALAAWDAGASSVAQSIVAVNPGAAWAGDFFSVPEVGCSDLWGNAADWSGALADQVALRDNLSADPMFCGPALSPYQWYLDIASPCVAVICGPMGAYDAICNGTVGIDDPPDDGGVPALPDRTQLRNNRPNPFNPSTVITFALRRPGPVSITVYDVAGRAVKRLVAADYPAGVHEVTWYGDDNGGRTVAAGVYFVRMDADGIFDTRRVALVK